MDYIEKRQQLLKQLVVAAGTWEKAGCQDKQLEQQFDHLLNELHPVRKTALDILYKHLELEVAV